MAALLFASAVALGCASALVDDRVLALWLAACAGAPVGAIVLAAFSTLPNR